MRLLAIQHAFFAPTLHGEFDTATNRLRMLICCKGTVSFVNKFDNSSGKPGKQGNFSRRTSLLAGYEKQPIHGPLAGRQPPDSTAEKRPDRGPDWLFLGHPPPHSTPPPRLLSLSRLPRHFPRTSFGVVSGKLGGGVSAALLNHGLGVNRDQTHPCHAPATTAPSRQALRRSSVQAASREDGGPA